MAVVQCRRCGAVVTAQKAADQIATTYGASYRSKCRALPDPAGADFVSSASECPDMDSAIRRPAFRIRSG